ALRHVDLDTGLGGELRQHVLRVGEGVVGDERDGDGRRRRAAVVTAARRRHQGDGGEGERPMLHGAPPRAWGTTTSRAPRPRSTCAGTSRNSLLTPRLDPGCSVSPWSG